MEIFNEESPSRFLKYKKKLISLSVSVFSIVIFTQLIWKTPHALLKIEPNSIDLTLLDWQVCTLADANSIDFSQCKWKPSKLPKAVPILDLVTERGWIIYRAMTTAPAFCDEGKGPCSLIVSEIGDAAELFINNVSVGRHGDFIPNDKYAKHLPVNMNLPGNIFSKSINEIQIVVRYLKKSQAGILRGPFAFLKSGSAQKITRTVIIQTLALPVLASFGIFIFALFTTLSIFFNKIDDSKLKALAVYGVVTSLFLFSYSGLPRELLPLNFAGCVHFMLRFSMDFAFCELVIGVTGFGLQLRTWIRKGYCLLLLMFPILYLMGDFVPLSLMQYTGFSGSVLLSTYTDFVFVFGPYMLGFFGFFKNRNDYPTSIVFFFGIVPALVLAGVLTFHGVTQLPHFVMIYPFFVVLLFSIELWTKYLLAHEQLKSERKLGILATQVAHDIRSPLAALEIATQSLPELPEDVRVLIRKATGRMKDIANNLLQNTKSSSNNAIQSPSLSENTHLVSALLDSVVSEKRMHYRAKIGIEIETVMGPDSYGLFSKIHPVEFSRVISNLVNNAAEAIGNLGRVVVKLTGSKKHVTINVRDNGKGMPKLVLEKLGIRGVTFDKTNGNGLGLAHAIESIKAWSGEVIIRSEPNKGTDIEIILPRVVAPIWFVPSLDLFQLQDLVILDDDDSIHQVWRKRFSELNNKELKVFHLSTPAEFEAWIKSNTPSSNTLFLCDFELLGHEVTGLDLIERFGVQKNAILVTSRFEEDAIIARCEKSNIRLIPKGLAGLVPVIDKKQVTSAQTTSVVLVDDDPLVHSVWKFTSKSAGISFESYFSFEEFMTKADVLRKDSVIYIDSDLGGAVSGESCIPQIYAMGFKEVYLATGYQPDQFNKLHGLKVVGKNPPWILNTGSD